MKSILIIITIILCQTGLANCQKKNKNITHSSRVIIGVTYDDRIAKDTLSLSFRDNYWGEAAFGTKQHFAKNNERENSFYFDIKNQDKAAYFTIWKKAEFSILAPVLIAIAEPGDEIKIHFLNDSTSLTGNRIIFTGKGVEKYRCQYEISRVPSLKRFPSKPINYTTNDGNIVRDSIFYSSKLGLLENQLTQSRWISKTSSEILEKYKSKLSTFMYNLLKTDIIGQEEYSNYRTFKHSMIALANCPLPLKTKIERQMKILYANRYIRKIDKISPIFFAISNNYCDFVTTAGVDTIGNIKSKYILSKSSKDVLLRDRFTTTYLLRNFTIKPRLHKEVSNALTYIKTDYCRKILLSLNTLYPGTAAFDFTLPDSASKIVKLTDFKGSVVILDFWFTGCAGCVSLAASIKPVIEHFKNNEKVKFISINVDSDVEDWKNSLRSGKYTHVGGIDLFAKGVKFDHAIVKHYNILAYPTLILIDPNGKIVSGSPPRPPKMENEFIDLIEKNIIK